MKSVEELLKLPSFGISELYLFPCFQSRQEAVGAGIELPPFNPGLPIKNWFDPKAPNNWYKTVTYNRALVLTSQGRPTAIDPASRMPNVAPLTLPGALAYSLNIPPSGPAPEPVGFTPCPFAPIPEGCVLEIISGSVAVVNKRHPHWQQGTVEERLANIQAMVHVNLRNIARLLEHFGLDVAVLTIPSGEGRA